MEKIKKKKIEWLNRNKYIITSDQKDGRNEGRDDIIQMDPIQMQVDYRLMTMLQPFITQDPRFFGPIIYTMPEIVEHSSSITTTGVNFGTRKPTIFLEIYHDEFVELEAQTWTNNEIVASVPFLSGYYPSNYANIIIYFGSTQQYLKKSIRFRPLYSH